MISTKVLIHATLAKNNGTLQTRAVILIMESPAPVSVSERTHARMGVLDSQPHLENARVEGLDGAVADIGAVIAIGDHHLGGGCVDGVARGEVLLVVPKDRLELACMAGAAQIVERRRVRPALQRRRISWIAASVDAGRARRLWQAG